jgi:hypothetical protein
MAKSMMRPSIEACFFVAQNKGFQTNKTNNGTTKKWGAWIGCLSGVDSQSESDVPHKGTYEGGKGLPAECGKRYYT